MHMPSSSICRSILLLPMLLFHVIHAQVAPNVTIIGMGPITTTGGVVLSGGLQCCIAMQMAITDLNARPNPPIFYTLLSYNNGQSASTALHEIVGNLNIPNTVGYIADYFSSLSAPEQTLLASFEIPQVGYGATSPTLSDKASYPYFLRTVLSDAARGPVFALILRQFSWQEVAVVSFNEPYSQGLHQSFFNTINNSPNLIANVLIDYQFQTAAPTSTSALEALQALQNQNAHVILLMGITTTVEIMLNAAGSLNMLSTAYQYIVADFQNSDFPGVIDIYFAPPSDQGFISSFEQAYNNNLYPQCNPTNQTMAPLVIDTYTTFAYDAILAYSFASEKILSQTNSTAQLFNGPVMLNTLLHLQYQGKSGEIQFDAFGDAVAGVYEVVFYNASHGTEPIGYVHISNYTVQSSTFLPNNQIQWRDPAINPILAPLLCEAGYQSNGAGVCLPCVEGSYSPTRGSICTVCSSGSITRQPASTTCEICKAGTHASSIGGNDCLVCDTESYSGVGQAECTACPSNSSTGFLGAISIDNCTCFDGFYSLPNATTLICEACTTGGDCPGPSLPIADDGYYQSPSDINLFYLCNPTQSCVSNKCADQLTGFMCASCPDGLLYNTEVASCVTCAVWASVLVILIPGGIITYAAYWASNQRIWTATAADASSKMIFTHPHNYGRSFLTNIGLVVMYLQIESVIIEFALKPGATQSIFSNLGITLGDLQRAYSCLFLSFSNQENPFWSVYELRLAFPLIVPAFLLFFFLLDMIHKYFIRSRRNQALTFAAGQQPAYRSPSQTSLADLASMSPRDLIVNASSQFVQIIRARLNGFWTRHTPMSLSAAINALLLLADFLYLGEVLVALSIFDCYGHPNGQSSLVAKPDIFCYEGEWLSYRPSAIIAAVLYGIGVPLLFTVCLTYKMLQDTGKIRRSTWIDADIAFSTLTTNYNPDTFWWHSVIQLKKLFISVIVGLVPDVATRILLSLIVLAIVLGATLAFRPFRFRTGLFVECISLCSHILSLWFASSQYYSSAGASIYDSLTIATFSITLFFFAGILALDFWRSVRTQSQAYVRGKYLLRQKLIADFDNKYSPELLFAYVEGLWEDRHLTISSWLRFLVDYDQKHYFGSNLHASSRTNLSQDDFKHPSEKQTFSQNELLRHSPTEKQAEESPIEMSDLNPTKDKTSNEDI